MSGHRLSWFRQISSQRITGWQWYSVDFFGGEGYFERSPKSGRGSGTGYVTGGLAYKCRLAARVDGEWAAIRFRSAEMRWPPCAIRLTYHAILESLSICAVVGGRALQISIRWQSAIPLTYRRTKVFGGRGVFGQGRGSQPGVSAPLGLSDSKPGDISGKW